MRTGLLACWLFALATDALAHRLDEYLQATRVLVATNRIDVSFDLTPGVAVADQVLAAIDKDRDGQISDEEGAAYVKRVLKDIRVQLDEKVVALSLVNSAFPSVREAKGGRGVIRFKASASIGPLSTGKHTLGITNAHLPAISVYLVNALAPKNPAIRIARQTRDELQRDYRLEFEVNSPAP